MGLGSRRETTAKLLAPGFVPKPSCEQVLGSVPVATLTITSCGRAHRAKCHRLSLKYQKLRTVAAAYGATIVTPAKTAAVIYQERRTRKEKPGRRGSVAASQVTSYWSISSEYHPIAEWRTCLLKRPTACHLAERQQEIEWTILQFNRRRVHGAT